MPDDASTLQSQKKVDKAALRHAEVKKNNRPVPQTLYDVLEMTCSVVQMHKLLKRAKDLTGSKSIRLGGTCKADFVKNIRDAVDAHTIQESDVIELIRDREESGDQHIFYFHPKNNECKKYLSDGEKIGKLILGDRLTDGSLPNFKTKPGEYLWADFRTNTIDVKWTAKWYGHQNRVYFQDEKIQDRTVIRYYEMREKRIVCLAHWNGNELEIRIGRVGAGGTLDRNADTKNLREIDKRKAIVLKFLAAANIMSSVEPWDLAPVQKTMLRLVLDERDKGIKVKQSKLPFLPSSVRFRDSAFGSAEFNSQDDTEELSSAQERIDAIKAFMNGKQSHCRHLVVQWSQHSVPGLWGEKPLRTVIGGSDGNEITIASGVNSRTVNYVTDQLRAYSS